MTVEDGYASDKGNNADKDPKSGSRDEESSALKINIRKAGGRIFTEKGAKIQKIQWKCQNTEQILKNRVIETSVQSIKKRPTAFLMFILRVMEVKIIICFTFQYPGTDQVHNLKKNN